MFIVSCITKKQNGDIKNENETNSFDELLTKLCVVTEFTENELILINLLQTHLNFLSRKKLKLIVLEDVSKANKIIWENFFIMSKTDLIKAENRHREDLKSNAKFGHLEFFIKNYGAHLGNEQYEHSK